MKNTDEMTDQELVDKAVEVAESFAGLLADLESISKAARERGDTVTAMEADEAIREAHTKLRKLGVMKKDPFVM